MSNRLFQGIIYQMKDAVDRVIGVIDETGVVTCCSELVKIGEIRQGVREEISYTSDIVVVGGYTYRALSTAGKSDYIVFVEGEDRTAEQLSMMLTISLGNIKNSMMKNMIRALLSRISYWIISCPATYTLSLKNFILHLMFRESFFSSNSIPKMR